MAEGLFHDLRLDRRGSHHTGKETQGEPEIPGQLCTIGRSDVMGLYDALTFPEGI